LRARHSWTKGRSVSSLREKDRKEREVQRGEGDIKRGGGKGRGGGGREKGRDRGRENEVEGGGGREM